MCTSVHAQSVPVVAIVVAVVVAIVVAVVVAEEEVVVMVVVVVVRFLFLVRNTSSPDWLKTLACG